MDEKKNLEDLYEQLIKNIQMYHPIADDNGMIRKAFEIARDAHAGQYRKSGEPFIMHPLCVAMILSELRLDKETIIAAILHDVVEDTEVSSQDIQEQFGQEVMFLVEGVTKLTAFSNESSKAEMKLESFRKLVLAMAEDIRVIIIKLADRLHNMRTLQYQKHAKQIEIASETMDLFSPIAQRLGISILSMELEDLSFSYLYPQGYAEIKDKIDTVRQKKKMAPVLREVSLGLDDAGILYQIRYEIKHLFSIYRKMIKAKKTLDEMYDIGAVKLTVNSVRDCYVTLGILHNLYKPVPDRMKDYIAMPKENMYQAIHTTLISRNGNKFEVQIKTKEMEDQAKYGVLANWKYGVHLVDAKEISKSQREKSIWLKQILEWQRDVADNAEFIDLVKCDFDLFSDTILCFTPKGDAKRLQNGSTIVDFAYAVHSDIGNSLADAYVNGKKEELDYVLRNGDVIEIITSEEGAGPREDWLGFAQTANARNGIKQWFRNAPAHSASREEEEAGNILDEVDSAGYSGMIDITFEEDGDNESMLGVLTYIISRKKKIKKIDYSDRDNSMRVTILVNSRVELERMIGEIQGVHGVEYAMRGGR